MRKTQKLQNYFILKMFLILKTYLFKGQMQGPFTNMEMSEWFKVGYFGQDLKVRRQCDERWFLLGELMAMCGNSDPFQTK